MNRIQIMDCTLRDGGWVNHFRFGDDAMRDIVRTLGRAGIEQIELGYIDEKDGRTSGHTVWPDFESLNDFIAGTDSPDGPSPLLAAMIDYGKFPAEKIPDRGSSPLGCIRICFHRKDLRGAVACGQRVLEAGYALYMQPMVISRYSEEEFSALTEYCCRNLPGMSGFYIVDSFGVMDTAGITDRILQADRILPDHVILGVHTHNNLRLSFRNAESACQLLREDGSRRFGGAELTAPARRLNIDCTLSGIGKGAGNLATEEFAPWLNSHFGTAYRTDLISALADRRIRPLRLHYAWGPAPEYELTSACRTTPTYALCWHRVHGLPLPLLEQMLKKMPDDKRDSFDADFAERFLETFLAEADRRADASADAPGRIGGMK